MEVKLGWDAKPDEKPELTRAQARHERRKRLRGARRIADGDYGIELKITRVEINRPPDYESPDRTDEPKRISKSKARKLRKKKKIEYEEKSNSINNVDNTDRGSPTAKIPECREKILVEEVSNEETKPKTDKDSDESKNDVIESKFATKKFESTKIIASENELFENEKNLQISESLRPIATSSSEIISSKTSIISEDTRDKSNFIITKNVRETNAICVKTLKSVRIEESSDKKQITNIPSSEERRKDSPNDEKSSPSKLTTEIPTESSKLFKTSDKTSTNVKMEKTREQIKMEREAKKIAKASAKAKVKTSKPEIVEKFVESTSKPVEIVAKKSVQESTKRDEVDGEILSMTSELTISGSKKKLEIVTSAIVADSKSKAELRAERRAKQEAQRAVKQNAVVEKNKSKPTKTIPEIAKIPTTTPKSDDPTKKILKRSVVNENAHEVNLFKHLYHEREQSLIKVPTVNSTIHPAIVRLGVQYANKVIVGSNARCVALLAAVKQLIEDFERPSQADFTRGLESSLQKSSAYLHHCRPLAVSMQNALRHLKWQMTQLPATSSDEEAKTKLGCAIDTYIQEQIQLADKAISISIQTKITNGDVILTYGYSSLINKILCDAHDVGERQFRVVVVDGRPWLEGREQLRRLAKHGLECSYVLINALSFIMPEVSKVFLGAHAILANGAVMSRVGTAQVALMAKAFNVPVLVACETHKTCERVQTDSIVYNEIANADELTKNLMGGSKKTSLINWRGKKSLNLLNLTYDVTPADLVTAVVTELAILPCTSVPVILRIKPSEI